MATVTMRIARMSLLHGATHSGVRDDVFKEQRQSMHHLRTETDNGHEFLVVLVGITKRFGCDGIVLS